MAQFIRHIPYLEHLRSKLYRGRTCECIRQLNILVIYSLVNFDGVPFTYGSKVLVTHRVVLNCLLHFAYFARRDSVPYAALYIAPILIDTRLHSTRGQFFIRHECGACIRLRTNTSLIRMISRSAYGFGIFVITCLHTSDERVQILYTSCIRIVSNPLSVLHT